ncbi:MAG: transposase [Candidatus Altiarchaeales archaeon]|nr:transposase [Candidatus Altiarchaeota archaeon]MBU4341910.1 transposase [Candidatus Altiarchaeota archaeon]MCG2782956.1 transposase [Candidatus Altiarchaeales archaeon]
MRAIKTVKVPLHFGLTERKYRKLDKLTARHTYAVRLFCEKIDEREDVPKTRQDVRAYTPEISAEVNLSSGFIQQAEDKVLWMYRQYREAHKVWKRKLSKAKKGTNKYNKLLKREPSRPYTGKRSKLKKIPIRLDYRTGKIREVDLKLTKWLIEISTLKKHELMALLLNPSKYHIQQLESGKIRDFELVKKGRKYYAHISVKYEVPTQPIQTIQGVDLGVRRDITSVRLPLTSTNFQIVRRAEKKSELKKLNDRVSHLRRKEQWEVLKKLRDKRMNVAEDHDRKMSKEFAATCHNSLVVVGNPEYIAYNHYKGNGDRVGRRILRNWSFSRTANWIVHQCKKQGIPAGKLNEWWTSSRCHKCNGKVRRTKSRIVCKKCGMQYDADFNASINILLRGRAQLENKSSELHKALKQNLAGATDELAHELEMISYKWDESRNLDSNLCRGSSLL